MKRVLLAPVLWLVLFMVVPMALIAVFAISERSAWGGVGRGFSMEGLASLADGTTLRLLGRSLWIAAAATALCLVLGYPLAWFIATSPRRTFLLALVAIPFLTNFLIRTFSLRWLMSPEGWIASGLGIDVLNSTGAVLFGLVHGYLPFMVLPLWASMDRLPPRVVEAARDLGASPVTAFRTVVLPLTRPGAVAGSILVFVPCFGAFVTPELLGGEQARMTGSMINHYFSSSGDWPRGSALALVVTAVATVIVVARFRSGGGAGEEDLAP